MSNSVVKSEVSSEERDEIIISELGQQRVCPFLASMDELSKHGQLTKWIEGHDILLYIFEGKVKAISNICRHFGGPVGYHKAKGGKFTCLWHNWEYDCSSGACLTNSNLPLREYSLHIRDQKIYIDLL